MKNPSVIPDEYPISRIPDTPLWSENYAAMFADPATRLAVYYSIGRWHADPTIWRESLVIVLPDQRVVIAKGYGRNETASGPGACFSRFEVLEPGHKLRLRYDGPACESTNEQLLAYGFLQGPTKRCTVDLQFDATVPLWNMKGDSVAASTIAGSIHTDQIGKVNGSVVYDGTTHRLNDGYAVRDHSRGPRDVSKYGAHCWINGSFPGNRAFYLYAMQLHGVAGMAMSNASIVQDDRFHPATVLEAPFIESSEEQGRPHIVVLECELGAMRIEIGAAFASIVTSMVSPYDMAAGAIHHCPAALMFDELVPMRWDGHESHGWSERGFAASALRG